MDDRTLLVKARTDPDAFSTFFHRHYDRIHAYAFRRTRNPQDAEEIAAATLHGAYRSLARYQPEQAPALAWLYRIAARKVADHYRNRRPAAAAVSLEGLRGATPDIADATATADLLERALARLSPTDRQVVDLAYFLAATRAEIGLVLGCTAENATLRLHRALQRLRKILTGGAERW